MCAVFGFLDYGKKVSHKALVKLLNELAKAAEIRGTDATGISYFYYDGCETADLNSDEEEAAENEILNLAADVLIDILAKEYE